MASAWSTSTVTAVNYLSAAEDAIRFNNKSLGENERNQTYKRWWKEQINLMQEIGKKAEQQSLAKYGIDFVTDTYLPEKLAALGLKY